MTELIPESYLAPLDLLKIFERFGTLQVDLGCGDGSFLSELASRNPEKNFLGIDKLAGRVAKACRKSAQFKNVRLLKVESSYAVRYLLPENSVETFYLLFPDPWPKARHHKRRIVQPAFLDLVASRLKPGGRFHLATDWEPYAQDMLSVLRGCQALHNCAAGGEFSERLSNRSATRFERRGERMGHRIHRLLFERTDHN